MEKLYSIGEVSKRLNISVSTLKTWERLGYIPKARRIKLNRVRVYSESQIEAIAEFIRGNY